jgi:transcriptional regulator with XRE-family HTH domain
MDAQEFGYQVLRRRKSLGLSQTDLARQAELSRNYVSLIERGEASNISISVLERLAEALGTTSAELTGQSQQSNIVIPPALREFGLAKGLSFKTVNWLAQMPRRGPEPQTVEEWERLYEAILPFMENED